MLKIRLKRIGRKHDPSFRIVVTESKNPMKGKYIESIGFYNPRAKQLDLNEDRAQHWVSNGAQPTDVVHNILVKKGVIDAPKIAVHSRKPSKKQKEAASEDASAPVKKEAPAEAESPAEETEVAHTEEPVSEEPKEEEPKEEKEEPAAEESQEEDNPKGEKSKEESKGEEEK